MSNANFYYDQLMNDDSTTFSIYLYSNEGNEGYSQFIEQNVNFDFNSYRGINDEGEHYGYNDEAKIIEVARGIVNENPTMGSTVTWNGSPLNLNSMWANLAYSLKGASRNIRNAGYNIKNVGMQLEGGPSKGQVLNWDQNAYYSINELQKSFGGMTTSTPLRISSVIIPYVDKNGVYQPVKTQLSNFLGQMYKNASVTTGSSTSGSSGSSASNSGNKNWIKKLIGTVAEGVSSALTWVSSTIDSIADNIFDGDDKYIITLPPPHGYQGVPSDFMEGQWMANTLAIRFGTRQLYNLLLGSVNVTVSKEMIRFGNDLSPLQAQLDVTFTPVLVLKPNEIRNYLLDQIPDAKEFDSELSIDFDEYDKKIDRSIDKSSMNNRNKYYDFGSTLNYDYGSSNSYISYLR